MTTLIAVETTRRGRPMEDHGGLITGVVAAITAFVTRAITLSFEERKDERAVLLEALEGYRQETIHLREEIRTLEGHVRELYKLNAVLHSENADLEQRADDAARDREILRRSLAAHGIECPGHDDA